MHGKSLTRDQRDNYTPTRHRGLTFRLRDRGKTYYGFVPGRGRVRLTSATETEAKAELGELLGKAAKGETIPSRTARFGETLEAWWASDESPKATSTRKLYRAAIDRDLLPRLRNRRLADIGLDDLKSLIRIWTSRGLSRSTLENYLMPVRGTFTYAQRRGLVSSNPCTLLRGSDFPAKDQRSVHEWEDSEIESLLKASRRLATQPEARQDYSPILTLAVYTGLRLGELLGLEWGDVDLGDKPVIEVKRQWTRYGEITPPKTRNGIRRVPLWPEAVAVLREQRKHAFSIGRAQASDPVFLGRTGNRLGHRNVQRRGFEAARDEAGLPEYLHVHDLRHAFASLAAHRNVPVGVLSAVMGHSASSVTERVYVHLFNRTNVEDAFRQAVAR